MVSNSQTFVFVQYVFNKLAISFGRRERCLSTTPVRPRLSSATQLFTTLRQFTKISQFLGGTAEKTGRDERLYDRPVFFDRIEDVTMMNDETSKNLKARPASVTYTQ